MVHLFLSWTVALHAVTWITRVIITLWQKHMLLGESIQLFSNCHEPKLKRRHSYCLCAMAWRKVLGGCLRRMVCLCHLTVVCDGNTSNKLLHVKCHHHDVSITGIQWYIPTVLKQTWTKSVPEQLTFFFFFVNQSCIKIWALPKFMFTFLLLYAQPGNMNQLLVIMPLSLWKTLPEYLQSGGTASSFKSGPNHYLLLRLSNKLHT